MYDFHVCFFNQKCPNTPKCPDSPQFDTTRVFSLNSTRYSISIHGPKLWNNAINKEQ